MIDAIAHLKLNLRLRNVLLAPTPSGNLLCFIDLVPHSLNTRISTGSTNAGRLAKTHIRAKVLQWETLNCIDAEKRVGLDSREASGYWKDVLALV